MEDKECKFYESCKRKGFSCVKCKRQQDKIISITHTHVLFERFKK